MLVLTRKRDEQIVVPECKLTVTVLSIEGNKVKLGFEAPGDIAIHREEIWRIVRSRGEMSKEISKGGTS